MALGMTFFLLTVLISIGPKSDHCQRTHSCLLELIDEALADSHGMVAEC